MSLDDVIAKLMAPGNEDTRGQEILAAAITLRDSSGRDRQTALRKMANAWGVTVNEKVEGKYKPRPNSALAEDIQAAVCKAALDWESRAQPSQGSDKRAPSRPDAEAVLKKARTTGAAASSGGGGTPASAPESPDFASEHFSTSVGDEISLDDVIAKVKAAANEDTCSKEILAAATTLRDSSGRDRQIALRKMANAWKVTLNEKVEGKYKPRPNAALAEDIQAAVCKAALDWESRAQPSQGSDKGAPSRPDAKVVLKKSKNHGCCRARCSSGNACRRHCSPPARNA